MEMLVTNTNLSDEVTEAVIKHNGEVINWNIALFDRSGYNNRYDLFQYINQFWQSLNATEQNNIFQIYKKIKLIFDTTFQIDELDENLYPLVNQLVEMHNLDKINLWVLFSSDICIPQDIEADFVESENNTRVKTYLQKDYRDLVVMTIVFRAMIPIWGEYISVTRNEYGTEYKEMHAFKLLSSSLLDNCPAMVKLREYVLHNIPSEKDRSRATAIISGLSAEELPDWLLGLVVVRKLSAGDLRGVDREGHLISSAYNYIINKLKTLENSFAGNIRAKTPEDKTTDDNKASLLEGYRAKENVNPADIIAVEASVGQKETVTLLDGSVQLLSTLPFHICPDIDPVLVTEGMAALPQLHGKPINSAQRLIAQWVLDKVVSARAIGMTDHMVTINGILIAQSCLWHKGHYMLAALVSALDYVQTSNTVSMLSSDSRARITKDDLETLDILYPYSRKPGGKRKIFKRSNPAVEDINLVSDLLSQKDWVITIPDSWMKQQPELFGERRRIGVPYDIRQLLSTLVIQIAKDEF